MLKIGEVSRRSNVAVETLRFYETRRLIEPAGRTEAGYRFYDSGIFERLSFIKKAQSVGFSLEQIARIIDEAAHGKRPCAEVRKLATAKLADLEHRIADLSSYRDELKRTVDAWNAKGEEAGRVCGLIEGLAEPRMPRRKTPAERRRA